MKIKTFDSVFLLLVIYCFCSCATINGTSKEDEILIKNNLYSFFESISNRDYQNIKHLSTIDFTLFENGKIWNNDSLIKVIKEHPNSTIKYNFNILDIKIDRFSARLWYINSATKTIDGISIDIKWLESATFRKDNDKWLLEFLHSTPIR